MDCREKIYKTTGGFIKGICHPKGYWQEALNMGLDWIRIDMPFPVDRDGSLNKRFYQFKAECMEYFKHGIRTIGITNYGREFIENGVDVRTPEGLAQAQDICRRAAAELAECVQVWQITNEVNLTHMRVPLSSEEGRDLIIACTKGVRAGNPEAIVGHNSYGVDWLEECREIEKQTGGSDYIGYDLYDCSWTPGPYTNYAEKIEEIWKTMGLPVILMEFGFASKGNMMDFAAGGADGWLRERGIANLKAAHEDPDKLFKALKKPDLISKALSCAPNEKEDMVDALIMHESESFPCMGEFEHTEEGQAEFYDHLLPDLLNHPHLAGAVLYCMRDDKSCYYCGSDTCCCEIAWGLLRQDGSAKPCDAVIAKHFKKN